MRWPYWLVAEWCPALAMTMAAASSIPPEMTDPISVRGDLPPAFKARLTTVLQTLDLTALPEADRSIMGVGGNRFVPQTDGAYDGIRDLVKTLNIDLEKMS